MPDQLTAKMVAQAAADGNEIARDVLGHSGQALGWAIAQVITLLAPEIVVVGGGVSLIGPQFFFDPLKEAVAKYVFPPLSRFVPSRTRSTRRGSRPAWSHRAGKIRVKDRAASGSEHLKPATLAERRIAPQPKQPYPSGPRIFSSKRVP